MKLSTCAIIVIISLFSLLFGVIQTAPSELKPRIIKGTNTTIQQFPYQISIQVEFFNYEHQCGGAILSPNWIITAAHCVSLSLIVSRIVAGATDLSNIDDEHIQVREIDFFNVIIHPDYSQGTQHDLALIKVKTPFIFNDYVQPVKIAKVPCISYSETNYFSGYGLTEIDSSSSNNASNIIQTANLSALPYQLCLGLLHPLYGDNVALYEDTHICTVGLVGPCLLDDGGPLVQDNRLIGILSWLPSICSTDVVPVIFQRIGYYVDFIKKHVDDLPSVTKLS